MRQPVAEMVDAATAVVLASPEPTGSRIECEAELVVRASTGPPPALNR